MTATNTYADPRPLPIWASVPIILACLATGGWIIHWYVGTHPTADQARVLGDVPPRPAPGPANARGGNGNRNWPGWLGGGAPIRQNNRGPNRVTYDVSAQRARATFMVTTNGAKPPALEQLTYGGEAAYAFVPDDVRRTVYAAQRLTRDPKYATALKLTAPQVDQVRQRSRVSMAVSPADRADLLTDFNAYRSAKDKDRPAAQAKLLADLDAVADRSRAATRQAFTDDAAKINAIITPAQWTQAKSMGLQP